MKLLAKAKRLGYQEMDIIDDEDGVRPVQEANAGSPSKPNGIETPKPQATIAGQRRPLSLGVYGVLRVYRIGYQ